MKVVWFVNVMFPEFARSLELSFTNTGGWMHQFKYFLEKDENVELIICSFGNMRDNIIVKDINNVRYYHIKKIKKEVSVYDSSIEEKICEILDKEKPDLIHIWGTEYPHSLSVQKIANAKKIRTVISLQGLIYDYAKHYCESLTQKEIWALTLRDFLRKDNIYFQMLRYRSRGKYEIQTLRLANNVIGRTIYDYSCSKEINPSIHYYKCNECLRDAFYNNQWRIQDIERNSIFISQANYPIKGFHIFLRALAIVVKIVPNVKVYVAGGFNPFSDSLRNNLLVSSYTKIIRKSINKYKLKDNIKFIGSLGEKQMCEQMLKTHIFVSPSTIENSPNSVGEAMILGLPVISSDVGGVSSMIEHGKSGLLFPSNQANILAQQIIYLLENDSVCLNLSENEKITAKNIYDVNKNVNELKKIYNNILNDSIYEE